MVKKVVMAVWPLNFKDVIEFEGSTREAPDTVDVGRGQSGQFGIVKGSIYDTEERAWVNPVAEENAEEPVAESAAPQSGFKGSLDLDKQ